MLPWLCLAYLAIAQVSAPLQAESPTPAPPKRLAYVEAVYPPAARQVSPPLQGIVILELTLNKEGRPVNIKVLRPIPLLDHAAVEAAKQWRYEPTVVAGSPSVAVVEEVVDVFPDTDARARYWVDMLSKSKVERSFRILAATRLGEIGVRKRNVLEALDKVSKDNDTGVSGAAARALEALARP